MDSIRMGIEVGILAAILSNIGATSGAVWLALASVATLATMSLIGGITPYIVTGLRSLANLIDRKLASDA